MTALVRYARTAREVEWDEWYAKACAWYIRPWWQKLFRRSPRLPGWRSKLEVL